MFVGRVEEQARLEELYEVARGASQIVLLVGETGIGKSRLVHEFARKCEAAGATVFAGSAPPVVGSHLPFGPVVPALRQLRDTIPAAELESLMPPDGELIRLLPGSAGGAPDQDSGIGHLRLLEEVLTLLTALGRRSAEPAVLILEDLHWADRSTLGLCAYLFRNLKTPSALVVLTSRTTDASESTEWGDIAREGLRETHVHELHLDRLADDEIQQILHSSSASALDAPTLEAAVSRAGGNPLFAEEIGREGGALPASIAGLARRRLERVSPQAQGFFRLTAAAGGRLDTSIVDVAAAMLRIETAPAVEELRRAHLLVVAQQGHLGLYQPAHPALFEITYLDLPPAERSRLHRAIAEALTPHVTTADAMAAVELGRHWAAAGDATRAHEPLLRAALAAEQLLAFPEAYQLFERAVATRTPANQLTSKIGFQPRGERDAPSWLLSAARCAALAGDPDRAVELVDMHGTSGSAGALAARAEYLLEAGRNEEAAAAFGALLGRPDIDAQSRYVAARAFLVLGDTDRARKVAEEALRRAVSEGDLRAEAHSARILAVVHAQLGDTPSASAALQRAHAIDEQRTQVSRIEPTPSRIIDALAGLWSEATVRRQVWHGGEHLANSSTVRRLGELAGGSPWTAKLHGATVSELVELGRWAEADDLVETLDARGSLPEEVAYAHARVLALRGESVQAAARLSAADASVSSRTPSPPLHGLAVAEISYWTGHALESLQAARDALSSIAPQTAVPSELELIAVGFRALADVAQAAATTDRALMTEGALELESRYEPARAGVTGGRAEALGAWCGAELLRSKRVTDDAAEVWRKVAQAWTHLQEPYGQAYARYRLGEALLAGRGGIGEATDALRSGYTIATELGAEPLRSAIEALARRARVALVQEVDAATPSPAESTGNPYGLSTRELEVLTLLVEGRTNRQIGEALFITEKTAGHHVSSILSKLGVRGRVEAAGLALREGLAPAREVSRTHADSDSAHGPMQEVVLMLTDIVKSTALVDAMGDETWAELAAWHERTLRTIFTRFGGREIDHAGDGFFVRFVDVPAALDCAREIQRRLAEHRRTHGFAPRIRIAVHRTSVVVDGRHVRGRGVYEAAKLADAAFGDEILVSGDSLGPLDGRYHRGEPRHVDTRESAQPLVAVPIEWR
jgi:class 3 adenylate cyclase/tetratricopeptide (TPR) repeat protein